MDYSSDTESDLSCSHTLKAPENVLLTQISTSAIEHAFTQAVQQAVQRLTEREAADILQDSSYLSVVQASSDIVLHFLNHIPDLLRAQQNSQVLELFAKLGNTSFQQLLLNFRKYLRIITSQKNAASQTAMVVTWADIVMAKLSSAIIPMAAGPAAYVSAIKKDAVWLKLRREEDAIRAATQLPDTWEAMTTVIGSEAFSPAARRLATSLTFVAYVMVPQITSKRPRAEDSLLEVLQASYVAINQAARILTSPAPHSFLDRMQTATLISLFADVYLQLVDLGEMSYISQLRPEGFGHILDSIQKIMGRNDSFFALEELDPPQCILLRWGCVVPWSWSTWNDQRVANTEILRSLSATWLYGMSTPVYGSYYGNLHRTAFGTDLHRAILNDTSSSSLMMLQLLQEVSKSTSLSSHVASNILIKISWVVVQYMEAHLLSPIARFEGRISELCKLLLLLFPITPPHDDAANAFIVETLALTPSHIISAVIQNVCQNRETQFVLNLEGAMRNCLTALSGQAGSTGDSRSSSTNLARSLLDLSSILLLRSTLEHPTLRGCLSSFISKVAQLLLLSVSDSPLCVGLRESFLIALAAGCKRKFTLKKIGDEAIWFLIMGIRGYHLRTAAAFSSFLLSTAERHRDSLLMHESWNYLLGMLTKIIEKQCSEEEEPLALLVSPSLCFALKSVMTASNELTRKHLLSSPWTLIVRQSLQELILCDKTPAGPYFELLKERLQKTGIVLLKVLFMGHAQTPEALEGTPLCSSECMTARLVYYRDHTDSGLVHVYDSDSTES